MHDTPPSGEIAAPTRRDAGLPFRSWTRNVPPAEALALLDIAVPGQPLDEWRAQALDALPHADLGYRKTLRRLVQRILLDHDGQTVLSSQYLRLISSGSDTLRSELVHLRYGLAHPWVLSACHELILPALASGEPLTVSSFGAMVDRCIEPDASQGSRRKTRTSVVGLLQQLGVLRREGSRATPLRAQPCPETICWGLGDQLRGELRDDATLKWACEESDVSTIFALGSGQVIAALDVGAAAGGLTLVGGTLVVSDVRST